VRVGVQPQMTDRTMPVPDAARIAAERGFTSFYVCEHTHIPVEGKSVSPRGVMPEWVKRTWDPFIALAWVAAQTDMEIGTAVSLPAEHDAIALAKTIATLDQISGGRFVLGVGWGWHREEFENHNAAPASERVAVLREKIELMREIWNHEEAEYHGTHVNLPKSWSWPKPAQPGGPPVLVGAPPLQRNFDRIAAWADGWLPMGPPLFDDAFPKALDTLQQTWEKAGRQGRPQVITMLPPTSADDLSRTIERAEKLGIDRVLVIIDEDGMADYERHLDRVAPAIPR